MAYLPKDFSRHKNKIIFGLTFKTILTICVFLFLSFIILKISAIPILVRIIIIIPILIFGLLCMFYKSQEDDDFITYLFKLLAFYITPKYLVYKKLTIKERNEINGQKDRQ